MKQKVRKAVFPVAGLGTRFLPATKAIPKEMLPVVDKPLIQYAVEEAREAGIEDIIFVTGRGKNSIEDHFDASAPLEAFLREHGKADLIELLSGWVPGPGRVAYTRQPDPLGLGHAVWCARDLIGDEPFAVLLADDLIMAEPPCLRQMAEVFEERGGNVVAVMEVPRDHTNRYGILDIEADDGQIATVAGLVEKPEPAAAPSTLSIIGRYILDPMVLHELDRQDVGAGGEIQLTDAMARTIGQMPFHGLRFAGQRFDCGDKVGFLLANVAFGLAHEDFGSEFRDALAALLATKN